jgi:Uma2 family endonuclease
MAMQSQVPVLEKQLQGEEEHLITGEELFAMGDIGPAELVRGEIIYHMPTNHLHGYIEILLATLLNNFVRPRNLGRVLGGEIGIYTRRNPDTVRGADVAFISNERFQKVVSKSYLEVAPEIVVEVMSPKDIWSEVNEKLAEYFEIGVKLVWVLDPRLELTHVYRSLENVSVLRKDDVLTGEDILPGLEIPLSEIFPEE